MARFKLGMLKCSAPLLVLAVIVLCAAVAAELAVAQAAGHTLSANGPVNNAVGAQALLPLSGGGFDLTTNYKPYAIPGQAEEKSKDPCTGTIKYLPGSLSL